MCYGLRKHQLSNLEHYRKMNQYNTDIMLPNTLNHSSQSGQFLFELQYNLDEGEVSEETLQANRKQ